MMFNAVKAKDGNSLAHHGVKGMKWGVLNPETMFKYGLTSISPAAAAAGGATNDPEYKKRLQEMLASGQITQAEYTSRLMRNLISNGKYKDLPANASNGGKTDSQVKPKVQQDYSRLAGSLGLAKATLEKIREKDKDKEEKEETEKTEKKKKEGTTKQAKASSGGSSKASSGGSGKKTGSSSKQAAEKKEKKKTKKTKKTSAQKIIDPKDIDEGPGQYIKDPFWARENAKKGRLIRMHHSRGGRGSSNPSVVKVKKSPRRAVYHSDMVNDLVKGYFNE